jgi:hypothetical protein
MAADAGGSTHLLGRLACRRGRVCGRLALGPLADQVPLDRLCARGSDCCNVAAAVVVFEKSGRAAARLRTKQPARPDVQPVKRVRSPPSQSTAAARPGSAVLPGPIGHGAAVRPSAPTPKILIKPLSN